MRKAELSREIRAGGPPVEKTTYISGSAAGSAEDFFFWIRCTVTNPDEKAEIYARIIRLFAY